MTVIGFDYPDELISRRNAEDVNPHVQTQLFARRLTRAVSVGLDTSICCISAAPISEFPANKRLFVVEHGAFKTNVEDRRILFIPIAYINHGMLKVVSRTITGIAASLRRAPAQRNGLVFVYSVHVPFMISGLLLARLTRSKSVGVWTDPPAVKIATDGHLVMQMRNFEKAISAVLMRRFDLVIAVTEFLAKDWAPQSPHLVIEAITDQAIQGAEPAYRSPGRTVFTYTGSLDRRYGVDNLATAALLVNSRHQVVVQFFGEGDYSADLKRLASTTPRIEFHGRVDHSEAIRAQCVSDFLINVRDPTEIYTRYSFPSKTLEYLRSGVPVMSTTLPGIPSEYWHCMIPLSGNEPSTIASAIERACDMTADARRVLGQSGRALASTKDYATQGNRIAQFLEQHVS